MLIERQIELLRPLVGRAEPAHVSADSTSVEDRVLLHGMIRAGFITCSDYRTDEKGVPTDFIFLSITSEGLLALASVERKKEEETVKVEQKAAGRNKKSWKRIGVWIVLGTFIFGFLAWYLDQK